MEVPRMIHIQIVGSGCVNCQRLAELCTEVVAENGIEAEIEKVTDASRFADLGIMMTPGLIIDGEVVSSGRMPVKTTILQWIMNAAARQG
jgi:small redox-active disulfide protein 2